jgi:tellurite resistance protein TerC
VLAFIGVKLILHYAHTVWSAVPDIPTSVSLAVVISVLAVTTVTSLRATRNARAAVTEGVGTDHG